MVCVRCGAEETSTRMEKLVARRLPLLCRSCAAKPAKTITGPLGKCLPWAGLFDLEDNPLNDDGSYYLPGKRRCEHSDCVSRDHVIED